MDSRGEEKVRKLFVNCISIQTNEETFNNYFSQYGEVTHCYIVRHKGNGASRGFGYVIYEDPAAASFVLSNDHHRVDNATLSIVVCRSLEIQSCEIFLTGLPASVTEEELRRFFERYGKVIKVEIKYERRTDNCRGFGYLTFETLKSATQVCTEEYVKINGSKVECVPAQPKESRSKGHAARSLKGYHYESPLGQLQIQQGSFWNSSNQQRGVYQPYYHPYYQPTNNPGWFGYQNGYGSSQYGGHLQIPQRPANTNVYQVVYDNSYVHSNQQ